jgi:hypothetical protein
MPQYLLLLHENPATSTAMSPEEMQQCIAQYRAWSQRLAEAGKMRSGEKLREEGGRFVRPNGGKVEVVDGPYAEAKEVVTGLFIVDAESYDEAVDLCRDCPHLSFGSIEVREIEPT